MSVILTFVCEHCGETIKAHIKRRKIRFLIAGKLYLKKDVLSYQGYFVCINSEVRTNTRFEIVW